MNILLVAAFVVERFTGLPSFAPPLAALLRASFSAERVPLWNLWLRLDESAHDASNEGITSSGSGDLLVALAGLRGVCLGGDGSSSSSLGECSGLSGLSGLS